MKKMTVGMCLLFHHLQLQNESVAAAAAAAAAAEVLLV